MTHNDPEIEGLIATGRKLEAIRLYRERYNIGLAEAKDAVEAWERGEQPAPPPAAGGLADDPVFADTIDALLRNRRMIPAIKAYRERYRVGLKEAKDAIDARAADLGIEVQSRCFIATAAYGDAMAPEVRILRRYRDVVLSESAPGRALVRAYYRGSPLVAAWIARSETRAGRVRRLLRPLVERCQRVLEGTENSD